MINFGGPRMWLGLVALGISSLSYLRLLVRQDHSGARTAARLGFTGVTLASMSLIRRNSAFFKGVTKPTLGYDITLSAPQVLGDGKGERLELPLKIEKGDAQSLARPDIYVEHKANRQLQRFVHPLWVGTVLMLLGGMVAIIRRRQR